VLEGTPAAEAAEMARLEAMRWAAMRALAASKLDSGVSPSQARNQAYLEAQRLSAQSLASLSTSAGGNMDLAAAAKAALKQAEDAKKNKKAQAGPKPKSKADADLEKELEKEEKDEEEDDKNKKLDEVAKKTKKDLDAKAQVKVASGMSAAQAKKESQEEVAAEAAKKALKMAQGVKPEDAEAQAKAEVQEARIKQTLKAAQEKLLGKGRRHTEEVAAPDSPEVRAELERIWQSVDTSKAKTADERVLARTGAMVRRAKVVHDAFHDKQERMCNEKLCAK